MTGINPLDPHNLDRLTGWAEPFAEGTPQRQAADAIKALRAEIERLRGDRAYIMGHNDGWTAAMDAAAQTHTNRVTAIRTDPTSYKHGHMLRSAKRASDFHERAAAAILKLKEIPHAVA